MRVPTMNCILCNGLVAYTKQDRERFNSHMKVEHGVSDNLDYLLAGCLMNQDERNVVAAIIEEREETGEAAFEAKMTGTQAEEEESIAQVNLAESEYEVEIDNISGKRKRTNKKYHGDAQSPKKRKQLDEDFKKIDNYKQNGADSKEGIVEEDSGSEEPEKNSIPPPAALASGGKGRGVARKSTASRQPASWRGAFAPPVEGEEGKEEGDMVEEDKVEEEVRETKAVKKEEVYAKDDTVITEKQRIVKECPYFKERPNEVLTYNGKDTLVSCDQLPAGWMVGERTLGSGRKLSSFVEPGRQLAFRSRVCMVEYVRWQGGHSQAELDTLARAAGKRKSL